MITRVFNAPRDVVWKAWTDPNQMKQWFSPKGFTTPVVKMDLRVGGTTLYCIRATDGAEMWGKAVYREVTAPEKIVYINSFSDEKGGTTHHPMSPDWPVEMLTTITFEAQGDKTQISVRWIPINASEVEIKTFDAGRDSMTQGWTGTFEQLEAYMAKK